MKSARFFTALMLQMMASGWAAIKCNEGTLLQVNFNNINQTTWDEYKNPAPDQLSFLSSPQPSGNVSGSSVSNSTSFLQLFDLKDYEQCISPEDATCFAVAVTLPPDLFEISFGMARWFQSTESSNPTTRRFPGTRLLLSSAKAVS